MGKLLHMRTRLTEARALRAFQRELKRYPELKVFAFLAVLLVLVELALLAAVLWCV